MLCLSEGIIRPAGKHDVMVTVSHLYWNTPDSLVQDYIQKFRGKLMTTGVVYTSYKQSAFIGKLNGDRQCLVNFSKATMKMGTFHFLDGMRVTMTMPPRKKQMARTSSCKGLPGK